MRTTAVVLGLSLLASQADAAVKDVLLPGLYYSALNLGDYKSSIDATARGGVELNRNVRTLGLGPTKIASVVLQTACDVLLQQDRKHKAVWVFRAAVTGILIGVMVNNSQVNRRTK